LLGVFRHNDSNPLGEFIFNPKADMQIEEKDILLMMGLKISIEYFKESYQ
jgi:uncharacterized protein with PhoU and TrkA domain